MVVVDENWRVYAEAWDPSYGAPAAFDLDGTESVERAESGSGHLIGPTVAHPMPLCFVDGRRRVELSLWAEQPGSGERVPGLLGAYAVGAVTITPGQPAAYQGIRVGRLAIWGAGHAGDLAHHNGYGWRSFSSAADEPAKLLQVLQNQMRSAEGALALDAAGVGWNVVLDGPLNFVRRLDDLVTGYVKSHHRRLLPEPAHAAVPGLEVGGRTPIYAIGADRYTCYARVGRPGKGSSPWGGIVRLEFPTSAGLDRVAERASALAALLPAYAGQAHRDPRAPVNLTPVRNLEGHLSHLLGPVDLAVRAAREAVVAGLAR